MASSVSTSARVGGDDDVSNGRRRADATSEVEWDGKTYAGSRLEYAGVEARGELRLTIPLHALAEANPDLKALLEVTSARFARPGGGAEESPNRLSVVESDADGGEGRREGVAFGVVSTSSSSRAGVSGCHSFMVSRSLNQTTFRRGGASTSSGEPRRRRFARARAPAKKKTPLKMKIDDAPPSKTMLSKVRGNIRDAVASSVSSALTLGVKKKAIGDLVAHTLAFYEYMFDAVDIKPTTGCTHV